MGATAVLVLKDGRQRNSDAIEVVFRDILGTEMKMYGAAIAQVGWRHEKEGVTAGRDGRDRVRGNGRDIMIFVKGMRKESRKPAENKRKEGPISGRSQEKGRLVVRGTKKKPAQNSNLKMVTGEGPPSGTWY